MQYAAVWFLLRLSSFDPLLLFRFQIYRKSAFRIKSVHFLSTSRRKVTCAANPCRHMPIEQKVRCRLYRATMSPQDNFLSGLTVHVENPRKLTSFLFMTLINNLSANITHFILDCRRKTADNIQPMTLDCWS